MILGITADVSIHKYRNTDENTNGGLYIIHFPYLFVEERNEWAPAVEERGHILNMTSQHGRPYNLNRQKLTT